jgi:hypothetical protein
MTDADSRFTEQARKFSARWCVCSKSKRCARRMDIEHGPTGCAVVGPIASATRFGRRGHGDWPYSPIVMALNESSDKVSPIEMMIRPDKNTVDSYLPVVRPALFRNGVLHVPSAFSERYGSASAKDMLSAIAILGALAMRIGGRSESVGRFRILG